MEKGKLASRSFDEYVQTTDRLVRVWGVGRRVDDLGPKDFAKLYEDFSRTWGLNRITNEITRVKSVFKFAQDNVLIPGWQPKYGSEFEKPSQLEIRRHKADKGPNFLEAAELRKLLAYSTLQVRALLLLGLNCGYGNVECATLPESALDLDAGWVAYRRTKTAVARRCPLWPETSQALRDVIATRPEPRTDSAQGLVFLKRNGLPLLSGGRAYMEKTIRTMKELKLHRDGMGFYTMRHVCQTIGEETLDFPAVRAIMGHSDASMSAHYRERIDDSRLRKVVDHIRKWLFGAQAIPAPVPPDPAPAMAQAQGGTIIVAGFGGGC
jgi:integrase